MKTKIVIQPTKLYGSINFPIKIGDVVITESLFALCVGRTHDHYKMLYPKGIGYSKGVNDWSITFHIDTCALVLSEDKQIIYCANNSWVANFPKNTRGRFQEIVKELFRRNKSFW